MAAAPMCDGVVVPRPCVFCAIVAGEIPASFVLREPAACAFLDARPVFKGHVLVVPPAHVVPRRKGDGLRGFFWPRTTYDSDADREDFAARIRAVLG